MTPKTLKLRSIHNGNARLYLDAYQNGKRLSALYCLQMEGDHEFVLYACTRDGEPDHPVETNRFFVPTLEPGANADVSTSEQRLLLDGISWATLHSDEFYRSDRVTEFGIEVISRLSNENGKHFLGYDHGSAQYLASAWSDDSSDALRFDDREAVLTHFSPRAMADGNHSAWNICYTVQDHDPADAFKAAEPLGFDQAAPA